jgi:thiol-disulfide isomerase/thioredoxin
MPLKLQHPNNPVLPPIDEKKKRQAALRGSMVQDDLAKTSDEAIYLAKTSTWDFWINSEPLVLAHLDEDDGDAYLFFISEKLKNKPVLLFFWDHTSLNCKRIAQVISKWNERYKTAGLIIIGVHSPLFSVSQDKTLIEKAVEKWKLNFPHIIDNDFSIWKTLHSTSYPRLLLYNAQRDIIFDQEGEGNFEELEKQIQNTLRAISPGLACPPILKNNYVPEESPVKIIYLGLNFPHKYINPISPLLDEEIHCTNAYKTLSHLMEKNLFTPLFDFRWVFKSESVQVTQAVLSGEKENLLCTLSMKVKNIKSLYVAAGSKSKNPNEASKPIKVLVNLNSKPVPDIRFGEDLVFSESKKTQIIVFHHRLYHVLNNLDPNTTYEVQFIIETDILETVEFYCFQFEE